VGRWLRSSPKTNSSKGWALTKVFLAIKYEGNEKLKELIQGELREQGVEPVTGEEIASNPPPPVIRTQILASDGLLAIITTPQSGWVHNEIGMAYAAKKPVCALIESVDKTTSDEMGKGILPFVCKYRNFSRTDIIELKKRLIEILPEFADEVKFRTYGVLETNGVFEAKFRADGIFGPSDVLASTVDHSNRVSIRIAIRPRQIPNGDEVVSIYIPPQFSLTDTFNEYSLRRQRNETNEDLPQFVKMVNSLRPSIETDLPKPDEHISIGINGIEDQYPGFWFVKICLTFPEAGSWLNEGWFNLKLPDVVTPLIAGSYRLYGTDDILVEPATVKAAPYEFDPIVVRGEITQTSLFGTISLGDGTPLTYPGSVRVWGTAVDPFREGCPSTGRHVSAMCYMSAGQKGRYTIPNVAAGIYDVFARALGYSEFIIATDVLIKEPTKQDGHVNLIITASDRIARAHS
jgi:hypothetical protein